ncbi:MAG: HAD family hydrolase [Candidatus Nealsonbacteria bacterium]|nr:HAD family hydrolase [Candidatus Nealsonbacteria bacterium]
MASSPKTRAIIFDFDGVIVESMGIKEKAFIFLFKDYPEHLNEIVKLHRAHGGLSRFEKFKTIHRDILKLPYSKEKEEKLAEKFSDFTLKEVIKSPFVPGAYEFLEKYYKTFSFFVASGTPEKEMKYIVKAKGIDRFFRDVLGSPRKKGQLCLQLLEEYKFLPEEALMVGDAVEDFEGAKEAKIRFIGRIGKDNMFKGLKTNGLIHNLFELEKFL